MSIWGLVRPHGSDIPCDAVSPQRQVILDAFGLQQDHPRKLIPPLHGALLKNEQDVHLFERLAFMTRRQSRGEKGPIKE